MKVGCLNFQTNPARNPATRMNKPIGCLIYETKSNPIASFVSVVWWKKKNNPPTIMARMVAAMAVNTPASRHLIKVISVSICLQDVTFAFDLFVGFVFALQLTTNY